MPSSNSYSPQEELEAAEYLTSFKIGALSSYSHSCNRVDTYSRSESESTSSERSLLRTKNDENDDTMRTSYSILNSIIPGQASTTQNACSLSSSSSSSSSTSTYQNKVKLNSSKWDPEDDERLRMLVLRFGAKSWHIVAEHMSSFPDGRSHSAVQCMCRWKNVLSPEVRKGPWCEEEDQVVREMVAHATSADKVKWRDVADQLCGRLGKQCRERWYNQLDPAIKTGPWSYDEDKKLLDAQKTHGNRWCAIAKMLVGRTENAVKNRFNSASFKRRIKDNMERQSQLETKEVSSTRHHGGGHSDKDDRQSSNYSSASGESYKNHAESKSIFQVTSGLCNINSREKRLAFVEKAIGEDRDVNTLTKKQRSLASTDTSVPSTELLLVHPSSQGLGQEHDVITKCTDKTRLTAMKLQLAAVRKQRIELAIKEKHLLGGIQLIIKGNNVTSTRNQIEDSGDAANDDFEHKCN